MSIMLNEGGQLVELAEPLWRPGAQIALGPIPAGGDLAALLADPVSIWRTQEQLRTVVSFLARNVAQVGMHAYERVDDLDRRRLRGVPLSDVISTPWPGRTQFEFLRELMLDVCLWDRWAAAKVRTDGRLRLLRIPPRRWKFKRNSLGMPLSVVIHRYGDAGQPSTEEHDLEDFVYLDAYQADGDDCEPTPMEALRQILLEDAESRRYREELWRNGGRLSGWIERPSTAPDWSSTAREKFRGGWIRNYTSGGVRAGGTPILEDGMAYKEGTGISPEDGQQLEARKLSRAEVAAAYHVSPPMVGLLDDANYSNVKEFRAMLYQDTLGPWLQQIEQAFGVRLVPDLDPTGRQYAEFNVAEKMRLSFDEQAQVFQTAVGGPIMTRNEARSRLNLPQIDGADELITPLNVDVGGPDAPSNPQELAVLLQKLYLSVGPVLTTAEAREIANRAGAGLSGPGPVEETP